MTILKYILFILLLPFVMVYFFVCVAPVSHLESMDAFKDKNNASKLCAPLLWWIDLL